MGKELIFWGALALVLLLGSRKCTCAPCTISGALVGSDPTYEDWLTPFNDYRGGD